MKHIFKIIFPALASTIFFSCNAKGNYKKEISILDDVNTALSKADSLCNNIDTTKAKKYLKEIFSDIRFINENYGDTLSKDHAAGFEMYNGTAHILEKTLAAIFNLKKSVKHSQTQAGNLINDLKKNLTDEQKVKLFVDEEVQSSKIIYQNVHMAASAVKENIFRFDSLSPVIGKFIEGVKKNN